MPEPTIIDTTVIQVQYTNEDDYHNLVVTPTEGDDIRIGNKRSNLFSIFQPGRAVKLEWAEFKGKKYVAKAELFDGKPPVEKRVEPITAGVDKTIPIVGRDMGKNRSFALSYAKDIGVAMINKGNDASVNKILEITRAFEQYLDGTIQPNIGSENKPPSSGGVAIPPKRKSLVEEAKKLGAIEP